MKRSIVITLSIAGILCAAALTQAGSFTSTKKNVGLELREGDILFQDTGGEQGKAVAQATHCAWTHVGIAFKENGAWIVLEAVGPVKITPLDEWIAQGSGRYAVKRWTESTTKLDAVAISKLRQAAKRFMGIAYDLQFRWSDDEIYCSELVWKLYAEGLGVHLCEPAPLRAYDLGSDVVQRTMQERYGAALPLDEPMVAPSTLFNCGMLVTVKEK